MIEHIGPGSISQIGPLLEAQGIRSCFMVADPHAYQASSAESKLRPCLDKLDRVTVFSDFAPNPDIESVERAVTLSSEATYDAVIAVGGGTAIDIAKLVSCSMASGLDAVTTNATTLDRTVSLITIPTTAGTGSEATHFAVLYIDGVKHSIAHPCLLPDACIIDADLLESLPASVAAHTGLDALCQSMESIWSVNATDESRAYAIEGLRLSMTHLLDAVTQPALSSRDGMARAAHLSGKAINIGKTTAPHAISYTLTSKFGIPHGLAVALTIGRCLEWNADVTEADCTDPGGPTHVKNAINTITDVLSCKLPGEASERIDQIIRSLDCSPRLGDYGLSAGDLDGIARSVNVERLSNNPRRLTQHEIHDLLKSKL
jgi:alcohol dehydrogenase